MAPILQDRYFMNMRTQILLYEYEDANIIVAIDDKGHIVKEFHSFDEIISYFNVKRADNVKNVLAGRQKSAYGYGWKYKKDLI